MNGFSVKHCLICDKTFVDLSPNQVKNTCCRKCYHQYHYRDETRKIHRLIEMRVNVLKSKGVAISDNEKTEIVERLLNGSCEICGIPTPFPKLCIDHNHKTNNIRGVICDRCNYLLGAAEDNPEILKKCIDYLNQN